ncbi:MULTISPECIES: HigA family addiction module antitoxin [Bifidobacterium]|uniref:Plasmid maintenance system antidote protein n=2 Tax=Bifidobacterium TaxID=1678 RepID=A0A430FBD6_9BIFI|nr:MULTISPECIES: HigA family addiction module antitoxin [Bifidobacterium]MBT1177084.1 HigA family addiction module antidote protein [Bifidobacterium callimiconis]OXM99770.1 plasmid maintenance system antidote protein [Bifidobacterium vansinderenii]RSX50164.1 plasmid maintenance system antidote protein [Bifidobacterium callimiconis]
MSISATTTADGFYSTPGEILKEEFLEPLNISNYRLAKTIGVSETAVGEIVHNKRRITTPMAVRLSKALGTTPEFWISLQSDYDLLTFDASSVGDIKPLVSA